MKHYTKEKVAFLCDKNFIDKGDEKYYVHTRQDNKTTNCKGQYCRCDYRQGGAVSEGDGFEEFSNDISSIPEGIQVETDFTISEGTLSAASVSLSEPVTVNIPDGVTTIGNGVFANNKIINTVNMANSVITIKGGKPWEGNYGAFYECIVLSAVKFSTNLVTIEEQAFNNCRVIPTIDLYDTQLVSLGEGAFASCYALTTCYLPNSLQSIGSNCFGGGGNALADIYYAGSQQEWEAISGLANAGIPQTCTIHYNYTPAE